MTTGETLKYQSDLARQFVTEMIGSTPTCSKEVEALFRAACIECFSEGFNAGVLFTEGKTVTFKKVENDPKPSRETHLA